MTEIPGSLYRALLAARDAALLAGRERVEQVDTGVQNGPVVVENLQLGQSRYLTVNRAVMIPLDEKVREEIFKTLGPLAENWSNLKLVPTSIYGNSSISKFLQ